MQLLKHLAHPSQNFTGTVKSAIFGLIAQQRSTLCRCGLENCKISSPFLNCLCSNDLTMSPPSLVQNCSTRSKNHRGSFGAPPITDEKSIVNRQQLSGGSTDHVQIYKTDASHDAPSITHVQHHKVKDKGHSAIA